jgi:hypothetical protein
MKIEFITPTTLSLMDITSMGDSVKRNDNTKIGQFDSGLKYAIALLLRNNIQIQIDVLEKEGSTNYSFTTFTKECPQTGKKKELIQIVETCISLGISEVRHIDTAFALQLGYNWELWMAFRELYSNMMDEDGWMIVNEEEKPLGVTTIILYCEDDSEFAEIIRNKDKYIFSEKKIWNISSSIILAVNPEKHLKIYKSGILVFEDKKIVSKYIYNVKFGIIDERRILIDHYTVGRTIYESITYCKDENFLREIVTSEKVFDDDEWLNGFDEWGTASDKIYNIASSIQEEFGEYYSLKGIVKGINNRPSSILPGRVLKTIQDSYFGYNKEVSINSVPITAPISISEKIENSYKIKLETDIKIGEILGAKCIADRYNKCIIVNETFNVEEDFWEFIVQYILLTKTGNLIENLGKELEQLMRKKA